jgi:hypothetical protein
LHEVLLFYLFEHQRKVVIDLVFFQLKVLTVGQRT